VASGTLERLKHVAGADDIGLVDPADVAMLHECDRCKMHDHVGLFRR